MIKVDDLTVYDLEEAAALLKVKVPTVRRYIKGGRLRSQKVGGKLYVTTDTLKEFLQGGSSVNDRNINKG